jgi:hypothetical protein
LRAADPKTTKAHTTGVVVEVNEKPKKDDPEASLYTPGEMPVNVSIIIAQDIHH